MRTLVFWGDAPLSRARARAAAGDLILLWGRREAGGEDGPLKSADWSEDKGARVEAAVTEWTRAIAEAPLLEGRPLRDLFHWEGLSLWPLVEHFFLGMDSAAAGCVRLVESFGIVFETELPDEVEAVGLREDEIRLLDRCCTAKGVLFQGEPPRRGGRAPAGAQRRDPLSLFGRMRAAFRAPRKVEAGAVVLVRPESAPGESGDATPQLPTEELEALTVTVVGGQDGLAPESALDGAARQAIRNAEAVFHEVLETLKDAPSTMAAFRHDDVSFADLAAAPDLDAILGGVLPRAVRRAEGVRALLRSTSPRALCARADDLLVLHAGRLAGLPVDAFSDAGDALRVLRGLDASSREAGMVG